MIALLRINGNEDAEVTRGLAPAPGAESNDCVLVGCPDVPEAAYRLGGDSTEIAAPATDGQ